MLKNRIIPCLDVKNGRVVKGINFIDLKDAGDPVEQAKIYSDGGADEICFLDITASNENRGTIYDVVERTSKNCFVPLAKRIIEKENLETFAEAVNKYKKALIPKAVIEEFIVRGIIIHIDSFGNLITNISKADFERLPQDAPYSIKFANEKYYIDHISETYNAVQQGERVALFNENNLLEIAINRGARQSTGGADILFGMKLGDRLRIESSPAGSRKTLLF